MLRAIEKVTGEAGMVALAYNLGRKEAWKDEKTAQTVIQNSRNNSGE
jgi:hypothetical protein